MLHFLSQRAAAHYYQHAAGRPARNASIELRAMAHAGGVVLILENFEDNVDLLVAGSFRTDDAYDLAFFPEVGTGGTRAVLVVTVIVVFDFVDTGSIPALPWPASEKTNFMNDYKMQCSSVWAEQHQLTTSNVLAAKAPKVAGVIFDIQTMESGIGATLSHSHWDVKCRKVSSPRPSFTRPGGGSSVKRFRRVEQFGSNPINAIRGSEDAPGCRSRIWSHAGISGRIPFPTGGNFGRIGSLQ